MRRTLAILGFCMAGLLCMGASRYHFMAQGYRRVVTGAAPPAAGVTEVEYASTVFLYEFTNASCVSGSYLDDSFLGNNHATQDTAASIPTWSANEGGTVWFDNTNDLIIWPVAAATDFKPFSVAIWVKPQVQEVYDSLYYTRDNDSVTRFSIAATTSASTNEGKFEGYGGGYQFNMNSTQTNMPMNTWSYIVGTYTTNEAILYINGLEIVRDTVCDMSAFTNSANGIRDIGGRAINSYNFGGWIGRVTKWDSVVASQQVWASWTTNKGTYGL